MKSLLAAAEAGLYEGYEDPRATEEQERAYRLGNQLRDFLQREVMQ